MLGTCVLTVTAAAKPNVTRKPSVINVADFALLLEYVADIPGIERIRYTTSHPNEFTPRLIEAYAR